MRRTTQISIVVFLIAAGCSASEEPDSSTGGRDAAVDLVSTADGGSPDVTTVTDQGADVAVDVEADAPSSTVPPTSYCEETVEFFCDYYLRCGRMGVDSVEACRPAFLEACNEVFEPRYASYVERGLLELSRAGIDECSDHLADVACAVQLFDLDLGCSGMWRGLAAVGEPCAPGIGSFVCDDSSVCTLGLDLCGTCTQAAQVGAPCGGDVRCVGGAQCVDSVCVARALPGESCADRPCVTGAGCVADVCEGPTIVGVGDACDGGNRCPYKSTCRASICVESALLGESCVDRDCASGWCDNGICAAFDGAGASCTAATQCLSGQCAGTCGPVEQACF